MIGGIEQLISERMDANRNNPEALMRSYTQNQQLIDLLALQKLKSEKEAAARQMQLQMQQQPQTIAQQREAELLGMTRDEVARNAGGAYQKEGQDRQQAMEKIANSGIASVAKAMPAMAEGGIVSFQEGGAVSKVRDALERGLRPSQILEVYDNDPEIAKALEELQGQSLMGGLREMKSRVGSELSSIPGLAKRALTGIEEFVAPDVPVNMIGLPNTQASPALEDIQPQGQRVQREQPTPPPGAMAPQAGPQAAAQAAPADTLSSALERSLTEALNRDSAAESRVARDEAEQYLNVKELQDRLQPYLEKMRAMERSPQENARERLIASLTNMAGRSTPGMTFAAGARGGINALARQRAEERKNLADQMAIEQGIGQLGLGAREKALEAGSGVRGDVEAGIRQGQASASNVIMARAQKSISDDAKLMNAFASTGANMAEILDAATKRLAEDPEYANIAQLIDAARNDPEKLATLRAAQEEIKDRVMAPFLREISSLRSLQQSIGGRLGLPPLTTGGAGETIDPSQYTVKLISEG